VFGGSNQLWSNYLVPVHQNTKSVVNIYNGIIVYKAMKSLSKEPFSTLGHNKRKNKERERGDNWHEKYERVRITQKILQKYPILENIWKRWVTQYQTHHIVLYSPVSYTWIIYMCAEIYRLIRDLYFCCSITLRIIKGIRCIAAISILMRIQCSLRILRDSVISVFGRLLIRMFWSNGASIRR